MFNMLRFLFGFYALPLLIVAIDALTKKLALMTIFDPPRVIEVLPVLRFIPVWNSGISFGLLQDFGSYVPWLLGAFAIIVGLILPLYVRHMGRFGLLGGQMMAGGAFGNGADRLLYGRVVDFVDVYIGDWHWPAFNVADMAITCGVVLIMLSYIRNGTSVKENE